VSTRSLANKTIIESSISDEENEEEPPPPTIMIKEAKSSTTRQNSMERLDTQVSTLHQDVATLSLEVRNAIQALQEMAYSTLTQIDSHRVPARSIPNLLQNEIHGSHMVGEYLTRSSSQPAEIWRRNHHIKSISDLYW
jgi:potassium voltage-gated channel Eag-related subfamily H protein 8